MQKFCFFYKPQTPNFGKEFTYFKLGKKEDIDNPHHYNVIFEADLPCNIAKYNTTFMDYSGLYALYKNNLVKEDVLIIHYDAEILDENWLKIIQNDIKKKNIVFYSKEIDSELTREICMWVYNNIDDVFIESYKKSFLSMIKERGIIRLPLNSQFACSNKIFNELMEFLLPIYKVVLSKKELSYRYAHLLERSWALFFAISGYIEKRLIKDNYSSSRSYGDIIKKKPILSLALEKKANKFSEIL